MALKRFNSFIKNEPVIEETNLVNKIVEETNSENQIVEETNSENIEPINESVRLVDIVDSNLIKIKKELEDKYLSNEAVQSIDIVDDHIQFNVMCETDIEQSVNEYNGVKLTYNKLCQIPQKIDEDDNFDEEIIIENHKNYMNNLIIEYIKEIKK